MDQIRFKHLLEKYLDKKATESEQLEIDAWYDAFESNDGLVETMDPAARDACEQRMLSNIRRSIGRTPEQPRIPKMITWARIAAAASILIILSVGVYLVRSYMNHTGRSEVAARQDFAPGHKRATLALADGRTISINSALHGRLTRQAGAMVEADSGKGISYITVAAGNSEMVYNTLSTARGEQSPFPLVLSDGTRIWLNAASSVTFPSTFTGSDREVTLNGEAYFEVAHDATRPFRVRSNGQTVEVLGTHFDINAYDDEPSLTTTLIEGSVKIKTPLNDALLKPGQQSTVIASERDIAVRTVNTDDVIAWKNGLFQFKSTSLPVILRQAARWYDIDVVYEGPLPDRKFSGTISRQVNASGLLEILSYAGVRFRIDGKKLIVLAE